MCVYNLIVEVIKHTNQYLAHNLPESKSDKKGRKNKRVKKGKPKTQIGYFNPSHETEAIRLNAALMTITIKIN